MAYSKQKMSGMDTTYKARNLGMTNKKPSIPEEEKQMDEYMCNDGESAQELARTLTKGWDKDYPVK